MGGLLTGLQGMGQAQPVTGFIDTALKYQQAGNQNALSQMQIQKEQIQLDELKKQNEHLDTVVDFRMSPFYLSLPESARPQAEQTFKSMGAFDENYRGTRRQMYQALGEVEKNKDALKLMMAPVVEAKAQATVKAFEAMKKAPEDPKLKAAYETARMDYEASNGKLLEHLKGLDKNTLVPKGTMGTMDSSGGFKPLGETPQTPDMKSIYGQSESGDVFYQTDKGLMTTTGTSYDSQAHGALTKMVEPGQKESTTPVNEAFALWKQTHPEATPQESQKELERLMSLGPTIRAEAFSSKPTNTPGVYFDSIKKKFLMNTERGPIELTSAQAKQMNLQYQEEKPVNDIRVMQQTAPAVLGLSHSVRNTIEEQRKNMGPAANRWREFWAGKIGAPDPAWIKLRTNVGLLETRLMKMHVGASGGEYIIKHFKDLIAEGKRDPENMIAALDAIDVYATDTEQSHYGGSPAGGGGTPAPSSLRGPVKVWNPNTRTFDVRP